MDRYTININRLVLPVAAFFLISSGATFSKESEGTWMETVTITGSAEEREQAPGSVHKVDKEALEQWRYMDVHRVLEDTPGVYIRQEDGYGLRPNIGMRGSGSDRSKKIALMEDGILFAPAPYSAPAAYYFPLIARMQGVEVFKGPSAIQYGPNTVGGAINFVSRDIPGSDDEEHVNGAFDLALGSFGFARAHGYYGASSDQFGWLLEGVHLGSDGFKELDGGGNTGFDKNDLLVKLRYNNDLDSDVYHQFDIKLGYADEVSDETYLGLTDADFSVTPLRRYAGSQHDNMDWNHQQYSLSHFFDPGGNYIVSSTIYRREFFRIWDKLNGFGSDAPLLQDILSNPGSPVNSVFYDVLTGEADSSSLLETLLLGANQRDFLAQGIQTLVEWEPLIASHRHKMTFGLRYHEDEIQRDHTERGFVMQSGQMIFDDNLMRLTTQNRASAEALAIHVHDKVTFGKLILDGGFRGEFINTEFVNKLSGETFTDYDSIIIPGFGFNYQLTPRTRVLGGVHKGFVPVPPGSEAEVDSEESVNYEFGIRYTDASLRAEAIGFFNDYSNLTGSCTFSSGCAASELDLGFNAGEADIWGLEFELEKNFSTGIQGRLQIPVRLVYTYTDSEFKNSFTSPRPDLRDVDIGDHLPYLPEHQLTLKVGLSRYQWRGAIALKYVSEMRTTAGIGSPAINDRTDAQAVVDLTADYQINDRSQVYFTADNIFDDTTIVARRPFGARPGKPRSFMLGFKMEF